MILKEYTLEEVLGKLPDENATWERDSIYIEDGIYKINLTSKRNIKKHKMFKKNTSCVSCKVEGVKFLLEWQKNFTTSNNPELNLYTENNIKMTVDHIMPKAFGGTNECSNLQIMCENCNHKKDRNIVSLMPSVIRISSKKALDKDVLDLFVNKYILEKR